MVEGGAQVIESFLSEPSLSFVDKVVITTAPLLVGSGVGYHAGTGRNKFEHVHTELFGKDVVLALTA
jgi:riboflavin biosynthesis pyrimidine reductase